MNKKKARHEVKKLINQIYFYMCAQDYKNSEVCKIKLKQISEENNISKDELLKMTKEYDEQIRCGYYENQEEI